MALRSGDPGGDSGGDAARGPAAEADGWTEVRPAPGCPWRRSPPRAGPPAPSLSGSRFWALVGCDSDDDDDEVRSEVSAGGGGGSPRPRAGCSVGDFVARAEDLGGSLMAGRRRAFAPGGRGGRGLAPRIWRPPKGVDAGPEGRSSGRPEEARLDLALAAPPAGAAGSPESTGVDDGGGADSARETPPAARVSALAAPGPDALLGLSEWPSLPVRGPGGPVVEPSAPAPAGSQVRPLGLGLVGLDRPPQARKGRGLGPSRRGMSGRPSLFIGGCGCRRVP